MSKRTLTVDDRLYAYLLSVSLREPEILKRLREQTAQDSLSQMQIAPEQGQFMQLLVELTGVNKAIEIGTYTGYSSICIARGLAAGGRLICCDINPEWTAVARRYWAEAGLSERIELKLAPALETLDRLLAEGGAGTFDFAFIDADKSNYDAYYERALTLIRAGGLIVVDNTLWGGSVADPNDQEPSTRAIRAFNDKLHHDERISLSLVPIADGLTLARKR